MTAKGVFLTKRLPECSNNGYYRDRQVSVMLWHCAGLRRYRTTPDIRPQKRLVLPSILSIYRIFSYLLDAPVDPVTPFVHGTHLPVLCLRFVHKSGRQYDLKRNGNT